MINRERTITDDDFVFQRRSLIGRPNSPARLTRRASFDVTLFGPGNARDTVSPAPKGPKHVSPGQRPGSASHQGSVALKGHNIVSHPPFMPPLQGLENVLPTQPRALPWAGMWLPLRGEEDIVFGSRLAYNKTTPTNFKEPVR